MTMNITRILFINLDRIGDVVRSTFLFRALSQQYPEAYIACLAAAPADTLLRNDPHIDEVFTLPHGRIRERMKEDQTIFHMGLPVFELLEELRSHAFDLVINPFSPFGALACSYLKPRSIMGRAFNEAGEFICCGKETAAFFAMMTNTEGMRSRNTQTFTDIYARILQDIGIVLAPHERFPAVYVSPSDKAYADEFLARHGVVPGQTLIGVQPGAFSREKMWPAEKFAAVIAYAQKKYAAKILINGSRHEAETIIPVLNAGLVDEPIIAAGRTRLTEASALIARTRLFISNDTGPMHIAAALGVPTLGLFGMVNTVPEESLPWGDAHRVIASPRIEDISVGSVTDLVDQMLDS
jgi:heptosyltransferase II